MKSIAKLITLSFLVLLSITSCITETTYIKPIDEKQTEILLVGTFHFDNPGADVVKTKTFDIHSRAAQDDLKELAQKIADFKPTKIFVEWPYKQQSQLDSIYAQFKSDNIYKSDEIYQLAFRAAKLNPATQIVAIDYNNTDFPFGKLMNSIQKNKQTDIENYISEMIKKQEKETNDKIDNKVSLKEMLLDNNTQKERNEMNEFYDKVLTVGDNDDFIGAYLTSEWMRRNLYMWSLLKKNTSKNDERVMVLLGSSHIAMIERYIDASHNWKTVELKDILTVLK